MNVAFLIPLITLVSILPAQGHSIALLKGGDAEAKADVALWGSAVLHCTGEGRNGSAAFELNEKKRAIGPELFPIDFNKTYHLEGWFRSASADNPASAYFGLIMYDENKRPITLRQVVVLPETSTELLKPAEKGATEVVVARSEKWLSLPYKAVAFDAKDDLSDLPNFNISPQVESVEELADGALLAKLRSPLQESHPSGTKVRLHSPFGAHLYWIANTWIPAEWTRFSTVLTGESLSGTPKTAFWRGTRYVQVFAQFGNWDRVPKEGARLFFDDLSFSEIAPPAQPTSAQ